MEELFDDTIYQEIMIGIRIARQIALGKEPTLSGNWYIDDPTKHYSDFQTGLVALMHPNDDIVEKTNDIAITLGLVNPLLPPNLWHGCVHVSKPAASG